MTRGIHLSTAIGALQVVNSLNFLSMIDSLGIKEPEWNLLNQQSCWLAKHRPIIEKLLKSLIFSSLDLMGVPRFMVPAEFVAAVGITFIRECNYLHYAQWIGSYATAEELGNFDGSREGSIEGLEKCTSSQIFALMLELRSDERCETISRRFNDKTVKYLTDPLEVENETQSTQKRKTAQNKGS